MDEGPKLGASKLDPPAIPRERPFQFTLRHLLLGMLAICVLLAAGVPLIRLANRQAEQMQCGNNLKQIVIALHNYHDTWKSFPPLITTDASGKPMHSWRMFILPFLESSPAYSQYNMNEPWNGPNNRKIGHYGAHIYRCPSDRRTKPEMTNYVAIYGPGMAWDVNRQTQFADFTDGTMSTILVVEIRNSDIHWMEPRDIHIDDLKLTLNAKDGPSLGSYHIEGAMVAMADGSVRLLSPDDVETHLRAMLTIAGGELERDSLDSQ